MSRGTSRIACRCLRFLMAGSVLVLLASGSVTVEAQVTKQPARTDRDADKPPPWQRVLKGDLAQKVADLEKRIAALEKKGQFAEAVAPAREAAAIRGHVQGEDHWETFDARITEQTCARLARLARGDQTALATALVQFERADELQKAGRQAEAQNLLHESASVHRRLLGEDHPGTLTVQHNEAMGLDSQGKYAEAESLLRAVLAARRRVLGQSHPITALTYSNLGFDLNRQGKFIEAEPILRTAMAIWVHVLGEEHFDTSLSYNNLAASLNGQGRYAEAEPFFRRVLGLRRRLLGEDAPATARSYNNLAVNLSDQGKHAEAEPLQRKALEISRRVNGEDHADTAMQTDNLATNLDAQKRYTEAEMLHRRAVAIYLRARGENDRDTAISYGNLVINLHAQRKLDQARPFIEKQLAIHRLVSGENSVGTARGYNALAVDLTARGKYVEAEAICRKTVGILHRLLGDDHPNTALSYKNLAVDLWAQGRFADAEATALTAARSLEAARLRVSFSGLGRTGFASSNSVGSLLALLLARRARSEDAWRYWESDLARGLFDDLTARQRRLLTPDERRQQEALVVHLNRLENQISILAGANALSVDQRRRLDELRNEHLEAQGRLIQLEADMVKKHGVAAGAVYRLDQIQAELPVDAALLGWLDLQTEAGAADRKGEHWACVIRRTGAPRWIRIAGTGPNQAWTEADEQHPGLIRKILSEGATSGWQKPLTELAQQRLGPLEVALRGEGDVPPVQHLIILPSPAMAGIPVEALLATRSTNAPRYLVSYAPSGTLFAWLQEQRRGDHGKPAQSRRLLALGDPIPPPAEPEASTQAAARPPDHGILVRAVQPDANAATAGIQPGDVLLAYAGTKLATREDLQNQIQAADPKATGVAVTVWRQGETLQRTLKPGRLGVQLETSPAAEVIRAQREGDALIRRTRGARFVPLPGTRREVQGIAALFDRKDVFLGSDASEQLLDNLRARDQLRKFAVIHLATHGQMDDLIPMNSRLLLSQDQLGDPAAPLPLNQPIYDGTLTAGEVMSTWKLNAELVVLSACQSGLGRSSGGEGFLGFAQAFFLAGGRSLVLSLWEVDDRATSLLMTRFYQNWLGKRKGLAQPLQKAEALREAKAWLRGLTAAAVDAQFKPIDRGIPRAKQGQPIAGHPFEHPHYWAGFILMGDPD